MKVNLTWEKAKIPALFVAGAIGLGTVAAAFGFNVTTAGSRMEDVEAFIAGEDARLRQNTAPVLVQQEVMDEKLDYLIYKAMRDDCRQRKIGDSWSRGRALEFCVDSIPLPR